MALQKKLTNSLTTVMLAIIGVLVVFWLVQVVLD
jgi:hypothetical protein